jgi:hypothetical protein
MMRPLLFMNALTNALSTALREAADDANLLRPPPLVQGAYWKIVEKFPEITLA